VFGKNLIEKLEFVQLEQKSDEIEKELLRLSKKYSIVTSVSSFIVLETLEKYLEHQIEPPDSLPKMKESYLAQLAKRQEKARIESLDKITQMVNVWEKKVW
jgi:hypothetical protein